jgi:hypothetical protein
MMKTDVPVVLFDPSLIGISGPSTADHSMSSVFRAGSSFVGQKNWILFLMGSLQSRGLIMIVETRGKKRKEHHHQIHVCHPDESAIAEDSLNLTAPYFFITAPCGV